MTNNFGIFNDKELAEDKAMTEKNQKMEEFFSEERNKWNDKVSPLFEKLRENLSDASLVREVVYSQAEALSYRQIMNDQINVYLNMRSKKEAAVKKMKAEKFMYYSTNFHLSMKSLNEKLTLIDANLAEYERAIEIIEEHITFLRDSVKNLESYSYSIKNIIEFLNYLGK